MQPAAVASLAVISGCVRATTKAHACDSGDDIGTVEGRFVREYKLPTGERLKFVEGLFLFAEGSGVRVWPASMLLLLHLARIGADGEADETKSLGPNVWRGRRILELGCGCGLASVGLALWGSEVVAADESAAALSLAAVNAELHLGKEHRLQLCRLDWSDLDSCVQLRQQFGPFDAVVAADCVLAQPPSGVMWRRAGVGACPPEPLIEATRVLTADRGGHVVLVVTDREGDIRETARALFERRKEIELLAFPKEESLEDGSSAAVFHFRWRANAPAAPALSILTPEGSASKGDGRLLTWSWTK